MLQAILNRYITKKKKKPQRHFVSVAITVKSLMYLLDNAEMCVIKMLKKKIKNFSLGNRVPNFCSSVASESSTK